MKNHKTFIFAMGFIAMGLTSCSGAKEQLGLTRSAPDEFAVVKRAPLAMPPNYQLRPPQPGAQRPQEQVMSTAAQEAVFGHNSTGNTEASSGEGALLQQAGAGHVDPNIRQRVDAETSAVDDSKKPVVDRILGWAGGASDAPASVVNAEEEAERLKKNAAEGRPVTEGETPSVVE